MDKVSEVHSSTTSHGSDFEHSQSNEAVLFYTPINFQDPFQLLHLKNTQFLQLYSTYCILVRQLEEKRDHLKISTYSAVIGISSSPDDAFLPTDLLEEPQQKWHGHFLSYLLGIPRIGTLLSYLPQECGFTEKVWFLDKLDLIERMNYPLVLKRSELEVVVDEDIDSIEMNTRMFERELDSIIQNLEPLSSLFDKILTALIDNSPTAATISFGAAAQALRQHIYWFDSKLLATFVSNCGKKSLPCNCRQDEAFIFHLPGEEEETRPVQFLCSRVVKPASILHWYEHQVAQELLAMQNTQHSLEHLTSPATGNTHHWTPDCYRCCNF